MDVSRIPAPRVYQSYPPHRKRPLFDTWIYRCQHLEHLEIALCRAPHFDVDTVALQQCWGNTGTNKAPAKLTEIRLLTDTCYYIGVHMLLRALREFSGLRNWRRDTS